MPTFTTLDHDTAQLASWPAIVGIDEVGRGCIAGPIMAVATRIELKHLPYLKDKVADSKALSEKFRNSVFDHLLKHIPHVVAQRSAQEVDSLGIQACNKAIFTDAIAAIAQPNDLILVDGTLPQLHANMQSLIRGESTSVAIAAASVLAKVMRDRFMLTQESQYPGYGFGKHKGYGTPQHLTAIKQLGMCPLHRTTFVPAAYK